jgi:hypothetical protein
MTLLSVIFGNYEYSYNDSGETYYNHQYIVHIPPQSIRIKELIHTSYLYFLESDGTEIFMNNEHRIRIPPSFIKKRVV